MHEVTLRFKTEDKEFIQELVIAWLESEGITIQSGGHRKDFVELTYVKEREVE